MIIARKQKWFIEKVTLLFTNISDLEQSLLCCTQCSLRNDGNRGPTSYNGTHNTPFMIVGEGPGEVEDQFGVPLIGPSGQLLDKALSSVAVTRDMVYTTNIIKCRPKGNRTPTVEEGQFCASCWLDAEINIIKPQIIVALGSVALKYLLHSNARITKDRGKWFDTKYGIAAIATYHPAYLLRLTGKELIKAKWEVFYDLQEAVNKCKEAVPVSILQSENAPNFLDIYASRREARMKEFRK
jgi:DNA polymerase